MDDELSRCLDSSLRGSTLATSQDAAFLVLAGPPAAALAASVLCSS